MSVLDERKWSMTDERGATNLGKENALFDSAVLRTTGASVWLVALWMAVSWATALIMGIDSGDGGIDQNSSAVFGWFFVLPGVIALGWIVGPILGVLASRRRHATWFSFVLAIGAFGPVLVIVGFTVVRSEPEALWCLVLLAFLLMPSLVVGAVTEARRRREP